jgi:8-amino-7-oxononanoate synthase
MTVFHTSLEQLLQQKLSAQQQLLLFRECKELSGKPDRLIQVNNQKMINFVSNNYLGMAQNPEVFANIENYLHQYGVGSGGSRLLGGSRQYHHQLEYDLAQWHGKPDCVLFNSGYTANVSVLQALGLPGVHIFSDKLNHASIVDGIKNGQGILHRYNHCDTKHLETLLQKYAHTGPSLIVTESIFSMDGDAAPLQTIAELSQRYKTMLMVDEAHAEGVFGDQGRGMVNALGVEQAVHIQLGTFGKAYGVFGAHVCTSKIVAHTIRNFARPFIYTTSLPPQVVHCIHNAWRLSTTMDSQRAHVLALSENAREGIVKAGFSVLQSSSQIIPIVLGTNEKALQAVQALLQQGIFTAAVREPTVPKGTARLRINITAAHSYQDVEALLQGLYRVG